MGASGTIVGAQGKTFGRWEPFYGNLRGGRGQLGNSDLGIASRFANHSHPSVSPISSSTSSLSTPGRDVHWAPPPTELNFTASFKGVPKRRTQPCRITKKRILIRSFIPSPETKS